MLLLGFLLLFALMTRISGVPRPEDATEFYVLVLGATLGMCLMVSANHAPDHPAGDRDGQRAVLRPGGHPAPPPAQQRSGLEIRGLRRRGPPA